MRFIQSGFKSHETLDLHKRNRHGQTGRGIKRKIRENHDPPFKRRITKYDDRENSVIIVLIGEQGMSKFIVLSTRNRVTFHDLDIRGRPKTLKSLRLLFQSVIRNITKFMHVSAMSRIKLPYISSIHETIPIKCRRFSDLK